MRQYGVDEYDIYKEVEFSNPDVMKNVLNGGKIPTDKQLNTLCNLFYVSIEDLCSYGDTFCAPTTCFFTTERPNGTTGFSGIQAEKTKLKRDSFDSILKICSSKSHTHCIVVQRNKKLAIFTQMTEQRETPNYKPPVYFDYSLSLEEAAEQSRYYADRQEYYGELNLLDKSMQSLCEKLIHLFANNTYSTVIRNGNIYQICSDDSSEIIVLDASTINEPAVTKWNTRI